MGKGEIISGGTDGQYQVKVIFDKTNYDTLIATLNARIPELTAQISNLESEIDILEFKLDEAISNVNFYTALKAGQNPGTPWYEFYSRELERFTDLKNKYTKEKNIKERDLKIKQLEKKSLEKRLEYIEDNFPDDETLSAWCADLTEDLSGNIGTIEVPGERGVVLIQPGHEDNAAYDVSRDGQLQPLIAANPYQTFYNLAMFPGWQKWKPTFRFGTITSIDSENDKADVTLDNANSSQQNLGINQTNTLTDVPVEYMQCNSAAFEVDDEVVVKFEYDWTTPKVIGFKDNPKTCYYNAIMFKLYDSYLAWDIINGVILFGPATIEEMEVAGYIIGSGFSDVNDVNRGLGDLFYIHVYDETIIFNAPSFNQLEPYNQAVCASGCEAASSHEDFADEIMSELDLPDGTENPANYFGYRTHSRTAGDEDGYCSITYEFTMTYKNVNLRFDTHGDVAILPSRELVCKYGNNQFKNNIITNQTLHFNQYNGSGYTLCLYSGMNYYVDYYSKATYNIYTPLGNDEVEVIYKDAHYEMHVPDPHIVTFNDDMHKLTDGSNLIHGKKTDDGKVFWQAYIYIYCKAKNNATIGDFDYYSDGKSINVIGSIFDVLEEEGEYIYDTNPLTQSRNSIFENAIKNLIEYYIQDKSIPEDEAPSFSIESIYF